MYPGCMFSHPAQEQIARETPAPLYPVRPTITGDLPHLILVRAWSFFLVESSRHTTRQYAQKHGYFPIYTNLSCHFSTSQGHNVLRLNPIEIRSYVASLHSSPVCAYFRPKHVYFAGLGSYSILTSPWIVRSQARGYRNEGGHSRIDVNIALARVYQN